MRRITEAIVHCTATRPEWWQSRSSNQKVKEVRQWHLARGWSDIGYHFLIDRDGTVVEGRPIERNGAHVRGHNRGTIGISLFGGFGSSENDAFEDNFTPEQDAALRKLLVELKRKYKFTKVTGHNQYSAKACPGFNVPRWYARKSPMRQSMLSSTTLQATGVSGIAGASAVWNTWNQLDSQTQILVVGLSAVVFLGLLWVARERIRKWKRGDK